MTVRRTRPRRGRDRSAPAWLRVGSTRTMVWSSTSACGVGDAAVVEVAAVEVVAAASVRGGAGCVRGTTERTVAWTAHARARLGE